MLRVLSFVLVLVCLSPAFAQEPADSTPEDPSYQLFELRWTNTLEDRADYISDAWFAEYAYVGRHIAFDVVYFTQEYFGERYQEIDIGVGYPLRFDGDKGLVAAGAYYATSRTPDYQWIAPALNVIYESRRVGARMLALYYIGLDSTAPDLYFIDPVRVGYKPAEWLTLGAAGKFVKYRGLTWEKQVGPMVQVTTKIGRFELRHFANEELQLAYTAVW